VVACQIQFKNHPSLIVCLVYHLPSSDEFYLRSLYQQLTNIRHSFPNAALWIGANINLPDIDWSDGSIIGHCNSLDLSNTFLDFLDDNALSQIVDIPNRNLNTLDVFVTDRPGLYNSRSITSNKENYPPLVSGRPQPY